VEEEQQLNQGNFAVKRRAMEKRKITIARLWPKYEGKYESRAAVIMGLDPRRFETICIYLAKNSTETNILEDKGHKTFYISGKKSLPAFNLSAIWKVSRLLKRQKVDILHCHKHKSTVCGTIAALIAGMPVVISHVHGLGRTRNLKRKITNRFVLKRVNKIFTVGEAVKENVLKANPFVSPDKVVSLGNSVDYERFANTATTKAQARQMLALSKDAFVFGTVARMARNKGQVYLIKAFAEVKQRLPAAQLLFVGDGPLRHQLEQQAAMIAQDSIHFLGHRSDVANILRSMDAYVQPSIGSEGMPRALLEAMAAGVPCIGTQISGIPEILGDGEFGYLVTCKDEVALAAAMTELAKKTDEQRKQIVEKAQQRVKNYYTHEIIIKKLEGLYEACMVGCQDVAGS